MYLLLLSHEASMAFVGEERRLVEGRGSQSFIVGVEGEGEEGKKVFPFPNIFSKCMISPIYSTIKINA
jgi:hypothetical protein